MNEHSFVYWYSDLEKHSCGYCKNPKGNISHGMWAKTLTVEDYQNLIDRGWRRSGNYCYKPVMDQICCPMYTIKCDALNFQLSKSQKKVIKKFNKYLKDGVLNKDCVQFYDACNDNIAEFTHRSAPGHLVETKIESDDVVTEQPGAQSGSRHENLSPVTEKCGSKPEPKTGSGADPHKPPCKKAKVLRMERKKEKMLKRGVNFEKMEIRNEQKSLEEFLNETATDGKHKIKLQLIHTGNDSKEWERLKTIEFELYKKYQMTVHNDPAEKCKFEGFMRFLVNSPLQITLERLNENHTHYQLTASLFAKYQIAVHNESRADCDVPQYHQFLIDSPLQHVKFGPDSDVGFGSFHQLYWVDDKLIAVGVIDILPKCVSAVYFFYDPEYRDLTLGTYGSLREVEFTRSLHKTVSSIREYYMGFYIHSCPKMRYKGKLTPSYLLCPESYSWLPIERCVPKLEVNKYCRLTEDDAAEDRSACSSRDVDEMRILTDRKLVLYKQYKRKRGGQEQELFTTIAQLVGRKCSQSLIFLVD